MAAGIAPENLRDAADALNQSSVLREAMGNNVVDHYVHAARWELKEFDAAVTDYELNRGFERA